MTTPESRVTRRPTRTLLTALLLVGLLGGPLVPARANAGSGTTTDGEQEAHRQLALAREELADGRPERALLSCSSALRLDPTLYEALLVKALAYEQAAQPARAAALLVAYRELSGKGAVLPEADEAEARLAEAQGPGEVSAPPAVLTHARVLARDKTRTLVLFRAESKSTPPLLHWRKPGGDWRERQMEPVEDGGWELRVILTDFAGGTIQCWVESATDAPEALATRQP